MFLGHMSAVETMKSLGSHRCVWVQVAVVCCWFSYIIRKSICIYHELVWFVRFIWLIKQQVKAKFRGMDLFKKTVHNFKKIFSTNVIWTSVNKLVIRKLMAGLALCVFFKDFVCWLNLTTPLSSTTIFVSLPNSICIATCDWLRAFANLYCDQSRRMICW